MPETYSDVVQTARDYYNSEDADNFYFHVWGGEDIHVGIYRSADEPIRDASRRTVERLASTLRGLGQGSRVLDIGSGYGGAARYLAKRHGCGVVALNLSERENERDRQMNREQGLDDRIDVIDGSFEDIPFGDASFTAVWSQDAMLHSGRRERVVAEAARVLKPGGEFVFTDPMRADDADLESLQPILDRIHLEDLGSPGFYRRVAAENGLEEVGFEDMTPQLTTHYQRVHDEMQARRAELRGRVSGDYLDRMARGLQHWVDGGREGRLAWGIFHFRKPA